MNDQSLPLVSVCILTKNPGAIFRSVLPAVLNQKTDFSYEVIVIDSGSSDGTLDFIRDLKSTKIKLLSIKPADFGHGKTRNYAVSESSGEFVAMITHDALPKNDYWLQGMIAPFFEDEAIAGVFGRHDAYESASPFTKRDIGLHFDNFNAGKKIVWLDDKDRYSKDVGYRQWLHYFSDNNAALRKTVWQKIPYPDVDFAEDQLWAKEIIEKGYKKAYADDAIVYHSHNYSLGQTFRRSYDESRALKKLFDYNICPSILNVLYQTQACSRRDINYLKGSLNDSGFKSKLNIIAMHFLKQSGYYLGNNFTNNKMIFRMVSLDNSIKRK